MSIQLESRIALLESRIALLEGRLASLEARPNPVVDYQPYNPPSREQTWPSIPFHHYEVTCDARL